jgi:hypothetical protein
MSIGNIIGIVFVAAIVIVGIKFACKHKKGLLKLLIGLVLGYIILGLLFDPSGLIALGWFAFSIILLVLGVAMITFIVNFTRK